MRHGKKIKKIGRSTPHRKATLQSMSIALIEHKRITTTLGKARALRQFVEPILTRAKDSSTAGRRQAFRRLQNKDAVKALYGEIAEAIGDRPGGYTRVVKLGQRQGDAAEMAVIELVDFNDVKPDGAGGSKRKTRRSRRRGGSRKPVDVDRTGAAAVAENAAGEAAELPAGAPTEASAEAADAGSEPDAPETDGAVEDAPTADATDADDQAGEAAVSEAANPDATGNPVVPQTDAGSDHPDAEQGADTGTGEPPPEAGAENQGRSGDTR